MGCLFEGHWYNKQLTTNPNKSDKSVNATALAMLLLHDAPRYWHGHPKVERLEQCILIVARMLRNREGSFARILRDLGFVNPPSVVRSIRAPLEVMRQVPAKRPNTPVLWYLFYVMKHALLHL